MKVITYHIRLLEPVLVTKLEGDPNSAVSHDYLPGSVLRGALISRHGNIDPTDPTTRRRFFDGGVRFLNGYCIADGKRLRPMPFSWKHRKEDKTLYFDAAVQDPPNDGSQWQALKGGFCRTTGSDTVHMVDILHTINVHTTRNRRFGRATLLKNLKQGREGDNAQNDGGGEDPGTVFRYEALAAGQLFSAQILCDDSADAEVLHTLLEADDELHLGGARSAGYGRTRIESVKLRDTEEDNPEDWAEVTSGEPVEPDRLIMTFLSDALLRNTNGQYATDATAVCQATARQLNIAPSALKVRKAFIGRTHVGAFNRRWGLPTTQAAAVQMGSVVVLNASDLTTDQIWQLEWQGIGERRVEGFGRISFHWQGAHAHYQTEKWRAPETANRAVIPVGTVAFDMADLMWRRMLHAQLEEHITRRANLDGKDIKGISATQLARLRMMVQQALAMSPAEGRPFLKHYLTNLANRKATRVQFARARVGSEEFVAWATKLIDGTSLAEKPPDFGTSKLSLPAADEDKLVFEFNLRQIDKTLARAAKAARS